MDLSIIIPIYNEQENIAAMAERLDAAMATLDRAWEVIYVNDGSTDDSAAMLDAVAAANPRVRVVQFRRNFGQTAAMMAGIDHARGEILVPMDGDLQNDPADIAALLAKIDEGYDVVSGWRKNRQDAWLTRVLPSRCANMLISWISGVHLRDYGCSLKAYRREVIQGVKLYGEMHRFIPIYANWQGAKVAEIPVNHHPRTAGTSKYGLNRTIKVLLDLIVVKFLVSYSQKPIYVFGGFGLLSMLSAVLTFGVMLFYKLQPKDVPNTWHKDFVETPLPSLVIMFFLMGFISILMGLIAELVMRTYYESQNKPTYVVERRVNFDDGEGEGAAPGAGSGG
ncbi:MAG: glycosyltransferase [Phycisphaera sp.]|nr:glycosyltransferase [Phycisphaera sp.]